MNAIPMFMERDQFRALLLFSDDTFPEVLGRTSGEIPAASDERLRALAGGELSSNARNYLLEELVDNPGLLRRLAQYLQDRVSPEDQ